MIIHSTPLRTRYRIHQLRNQRAQLGLACPRTGGSQWTISRAKIPHDCSGYMRGNLPHDLPAQPHLAVGMAVAQWPWSILFADDLWGLRGFRCLSDCCGPCPSEHLSLISFTIWSSIVHAGIMAVQATHDGHETGHLVGDVPAPRVDESRRECVEPAHRNHGRNDGRQRCG